MQRNLGQLSALRQRLSTSAHAMLAAAGHRTALLGRALHSVSPLATLDRGYAIVMDASTNKALLDASDVRVGDDIRAHLARGEIVATVNEVTSDD